MKDAWHYHLFRLFVVLFLLGGMGALAGHAMEVLLVSLVAYMAWTLRQMSRLHQWLHTPNPEELPPDSHGLWGDIFDGIYRLQKHHKKTQTQLQAFVDRIQQSANSLKDAVIITDSRGAIEWWNHAATSMLGLQTRTDVGQRIYNLLRHPVFKNYFEHGDYTNPIEIPSPGKTGVYLKIAISTFGDGDRLMIVQDVTRLHRLEQTRRDFVSNASHELRTPLTVISGYIETMLDNKETLPEKWHRALRSMYQQAQRMGNLIQDLLLLSRFETSDARTNPRRIDMTALLRSLEQDAATLNQEKQHRIKFITEAGDLLGDDQQIQSAFSNLLFNAIKYTPPGGEIRVRWIKEKNGVYFSVSDNGKGFDPVHIPRLTERFYRIDSGRNSEDGGTGLGLAIVKHVLINHDGVLKIHSQPGEGSEFTCFFPNTRYAGNENEDQRTESLTFPSPIQKNRPGR